jgi:Animal haem peroxidase
MGVFARPLASLATAIDRTIGWDRLPRSLGLLTLIGVRSRLRARNLYDTGLDRPAPPAPADPDIRTVDGSYNDLEEPVMGSVGTRFGRNVDPKSTFPDVPELLNPNPREVSRKLLTREQFIPAWTLNVLAAAWIQFEVHDWFSHRFEDQNPFEIPIADDDKWPEQPMRIKRTERDPTFGGDGSPPTFVTHDSHWWDGSQIYGSDPRFANAIRTPDGKLVLDENKLPPAKLLEEAIRLSPTAVNFWVGLGLLHTLFMREHNAIVDHLLAEERGRSWTPDELYNTARLINAALTAKIHTVEWTPAIIAHPTTESGMRANWYGLMGERFLKRFGRLGRGDVLSGIPGSPTDHHTAPYSLTEEFVAVYRMHPLIPDEYVFRSVENDAELGKLELPQLDAWQTHGRLVEFGMANLLYSFGIAHPGAITLHNYPRHLQQLTRTVGDAVENIDLAATDILRMRERGVPRYNEFRRLFHRRPIKSFEDLNPNPVVADELRRVYRDVDQLDLMIGLYAEPAPKGFAFSDTTFRVFILMASRRLKSDRFFTSGYTPEVYTQAGLDWIADATMSKVLLRHYPQLAPALCGVDNAFKPWNRVR